MYNPKLYISTGSTHFHQENHIVLGLRPKKKKALFNKYMIATIYYLDMK